MEEELKELTVVNDNCDYILLKSRGSILIRNNPSDFSIHLYNEDIAPLLDIIHCFLVEAPTVGEEEEYISPSSDYYMKRVRGGMFLSSDYGDDVFIYKDDLEEVVSAIKILTGETKWKKC